MPVSISPSFLLYCYVTAITPGPANLCSLSAALRYGKGPALRQWRGMFVGFLIDALAAVLINRLLGTVLNRYVSVLSWIGAAYILWMAWHMLRSSGTTEENDSSAPSFRTGLLVQLTNVKVIVFLSHCARLVCAAVYRFLLGAAWRRSVPPVHGTSCQFSVAVRRCFAAEAIRQPPQSGRHSHGRCARALRRQPRVAAVNCGRLLFRRS